MIDRKARISLAVRVLSVSVYVCYSQRMTTDSKAYAKWCQTFSYGDRVQRIGDGALGMVTSRRGEPVEFQRDGAMVSRPIMMGNLRKL